MHSTQVAASFLFACCAMGCTPINEVKRGAAGETQSSAMSPQLDAAAESSGNTVSTKTGAGTVVAESTPCSEEGARACAGHGVREISVCKAGVWTSDTPCKVNERCDSTLGRCAQIAAVCAGQEAGSEFCDGDKRLVCHDLVAAIELPCAANQQCSRKDGKVSCTCVPGAVQSAQGIGCELVSGCNADGSSCDPLTRCSSSGPDASGCTDCPEGYTGSGRKGCVPQLTSLSVACGPGSAPRMLAVTPGVYEYRVSVPILCQSPQLTAAGPTDAQLEIDGVTVQPEAGWSSTLLHVGDNPIKIVITAAKSGRSSSYQLKIERAAGKLDYIKASNAGSNDSFGFAIAAHADSLLVGAPFEYGDGSSPDNNRLPNAGAAYLFELDGDTWVETHYLKAPAPREGEMFGASVAIAGDVLVIGAPRFNVALFKVAPPSEPGTAHVFSRQGSVWKHETTLTPDEGSGADMFGFHVAVHGETILVGAPYDDMAGARAGAVYSFVRRNGAWTREQKVVSANPVPESSLGVSMAIEGDVFVAGAQQDPSAGEASGSAYVFQRSGGAWSQQERLQAPAPKALATFGMSVAIQTGRILVTAPGLDLRQRPTPPGEAFLFQRDPASNKWSMSGKFQAAAPRSVDLFGAAAALSADTVILGANGDASSSRGIDGDADRTDAALSGAAYLFGLQGSEYFQSAYLKPFNTDADDCYGHSVAATSSFLAIGAPYESSNQRGVSAQDLANGSDNSAGASGAVYVYR